MHIRYKYIIVRDVFLDNGLYNYILLNQYWRQRRDLSNRSKRQEGFCFVYNKVYNYGQFFSRQRENEMKFLITLGILFSRLLQNPLLYYDSTLYISIQYKRNSYL